MSEGRSCWVSEDGPESEAWSDHLHLSLGDEAVQLLQQLQLTASIDLRLQNIIKKLKSPKYMIIGQKRRKENFYCLDTSLYI